MYMKKLSLIALALIAAMSGIAAPDKTPTKADLANYYQPGQLCVCVYFEEAVCNDVVFVGTYNSWATGDVEALAKFESVEGFEGWYVVAVTDESEDIQGKPVQLKSDGTFSWDYQTGDENSWTLVSGTVSIQAELFGESNLRYYGTDEPAILISHYFKKHNNPCNEVRHDYTVNLKAPVCADADGNYFTPAIIGSFNNWAEGVAMILDEETQVYSYTFNDRKGGEFKFKAIGDTDWSNQIQILVTNEETGESKWWDNPNIVLDTDTVITLDYSEGRYTLCTEDTPLNFQSGYLYYKITSTTNLTVEVTYQEAWSSDNYKGLTSVTIPATVTYNGTTYTVTSIGESAFAICTGLTSITIPNSVTSIESFTFAGCTALTSITIPNSITKIGDGAFSSCTGLTSVTIPNSVTRIGESAFSSCESLASITIPNSVTSIEQMAFWGCKSLSSITIPNSVTSIKYATFTYCTGLTSITIPNSVTGIGKEAFSYCTGLTSVTIPNSVMWIEYLAFAGCTSLSSITIGNSVTSMDYAFHSCTNLTSIHILTETPPTISSETFMNTSVGEIYVPCSTKEAYQTADTWSSFTNYIETPPYILLITPQDETMGSVRITKEATCADNTAVFEATANEGYQFSQWSDGITDNPRTVIVDEDITLMAQFISTPTAIDNTPANDITTPQKVLRNGQVYLLRNGKTYTLTGIEME